MDLPEPSDVADPRIGTVLQDRYRVVARVAAGGMGVVYRGERLGLGRAVAIKFLHADAEAEPGTRRRFEIEARAASRMSHPGCVPVIDYGVERGAPYLVMEYVAGRNLRALLDERVPPWPRALALARQVLAGLAHAHAHGIVHRDLKPENILVWADALGDHAQLTDFGLAKLAPDPRADSLGLAIGTPRYMSPEQTLGHPVDARSDVYAMGVLLFELCTGVTPFAAAHPFDTMALHREAPVPWFDDVAPERAVPPQVEAVVRTALAKRPDDRYPSAIELARALEAATASAHAAVAGDSISTLLAAMRPPIGRWLVAATGALALGVGLAHLLG